MLEPKMIALVQNVVIKNPVNFLKTFPILFSKLKSANTSLDAK